MVFNLLTCIKYFYRFCIEVKSKIKEGRMRIYFDFEINITVLSVFIQINLEILVIPMAILKVLNKEFLMIC